MYGKPLSLTRMLFTVIGITGACLIPLDCLGQVSVVRSGSFEIGGFAGASYGVDRYRAIGGGNLTYAVNRWLLPYVEYSYFPGIARTISQTIPGSSVTFQVNDSVPFSDFHGGVHIRIPIRESRIVPYLVFGVGGLTHFSHTTTVTYTGADGLQHSIPGGTDPGGTDFAVNFGGGLRYYVNQRFGFRVEAKGYKPDSSITAAFGKVEAGIFYQLR
jgi:hypothetical protein